MGNTTNTTKTTHVYEKPHITDYGDVLELTESVWGCGHDDAASKSATAFKVLSVPFGTGGCQMPS